MCGQLTGHGTAMLVGMGLALEPPCYFRSASQVALVVKNLPANAGDVRNVSFTPGSRKIPWRKAWQPTPVFLPEESHGQRSLVGYGPQGYKESDTTEAT